MSTSNNTNVEQFVNAENFNVELYTFRSNGAQSLELPSGDALTNNVNHISDVQVNGAPVTEITEAEVKAISETMSAKAFEEINSTPAYTARARYAAFPGKRRQRPYDEYCDRTEVITTAETITNRLLWRFPYDDSMTKCDAFIADGLGIRHVGRNQYVFQDIVRAEKILDRCKYTTNAALAVLQISRKEFVARRAALMNANMVDSSMWHTFKNMAHPGKILWVYSEEFIRLIANTHLDVISALDVVAYLNACGVNDLNDKGSIYAALASRGIYPIKNSRGMYFKSDLDKYINTCKDYPYSAEDLARLLDCCIETIRTYTAANIFEDNVITVPGDRRRYSEDALGIAMAYKDQMKANRKNRTRREAEQA